MWIGFTQESNKPVSIEGQDSWTEFYNNNCGDCVVLEPKFGRWLSTSCESSIWKTKALCQRLIGIADIGEINKKIGFSYCFLVDSKFFDTVSKCKIILFHIYFSTF